MFKRAISHNAEKIVKFMITHNYYDKGMKCPRCGHYTLIQPGPRDKSGRPAVPPVCCWPDCGWSVQPSDAPTHKAEMTQTAINQRRSEALNYFWQYSIPVGKKGLYNKFSNFKADTTIQQSAEKAAKSAADRMLNAKPVHFVLAGSKGIGKTRLAYDMINYLFHVMSYRPKVIFLNMPRVAQVQQKIITDDSVKKLFMSIIDQLGKADLVVLDDMGQEKQTDWGQMIINTVANVRQDKAIIMTSRSSNLSESYTAQTRDRLLRGQNNVWYGTLSTPSSSVDSKFSRLVNPDGQVKSDGADDHNPYKI